MVIGYRSATEKYSQTIILVIILAATVFLFFEVIFCFARLFPKNSLKRFLGSMALRCGETTMRMEFAFLRGGIGGREENRPQNIHNVHTRCIVKTSGFTRGACKNRGFC